MATVTIYPTVDGGVGHTGSGLFPWSVMVLGAGTEVTTPPGDGYVDSTYYQCGTFATTWNRLRRRILTFDLLTGGVPVGATISSIVFYTKPSEKNDLSGDTPDVNIYPAAPASNIILAAGDYDSIGPLGAETAYCATAITIAAWQVAVDAGLFVSFDFNAAGLADAQAALAGDGWLQIGTRGVKYDVANSAPSFVSLQVTYLRGYAVSNPSVPTRPYIVVTYTGDSTVTTQAATNITAISATGHGTIVSIGSAPVTQHGVCWSTSANPTTANSKTTQGAADAGTFNSSITGLTAGTVYHCRAYATNSYGTSYGADVTFKTLAAALANIIAVYSHHYVLVDWDDDDDLTDAESDITADVVDIDTQTGKDRELGRATAASMALTVKNSNHKYSPPNASSVLNQGGNTLRAGHKVIAGISFPFDSFTDADAVTLAAHIPDAPYNPVSLWTEASGTWSIDTNKVKETAGAGLAIMETGEKDAHIAVTFTKGANNDGIIVFRYTNTSNYMYIRTDGTNLEVRKVVATVDSLVAEAALAWANAATKTVKVILHGAFIYVLADMSLIVSTSDTANLTATKHGIGGASINSAARYDNWGCSYNLFYGTIDRIGPNPGIEARTAYIECSNDFKTLAQLKLRRRAYPLTGFPEGTGEFIQEILVNNASKAAQLGFILDEGVTIQAFTKAWWDVYALEQLHQIESEENGFFYQDPDGLWRFEARGHRAAAPHDAARSIIYAIRATNSIFMTDMKWRSGMEDVINRVTVNYKLSVKQQIEDVALIADVTDEYDLWICQEAHVVHGPVTSSTLSVTAGTPKVIYFEADGFDAIAGLVDPVSTVVQELIEGQITADPNVIKEFKLGETVTGSVSGHTGKVQEASSKSILVKLDVADNLFVTTDTISGGTSGAAMGAVGDLTITDYNDYKANAAANGGGLDKTAQLTVALAAIDSSDEFNYGKGGKLTLTCATGTIWVTWLRVRGHGYKLLDAIGAYVVDATSEEDYGERSCVVDSELFTTYDECKALADDIEDKEDNPRAKIDVVMVNSTKETLMQILARRLSDRVTLNWSAFGVNEDFYINSLKHHIYNGGASIDCIMCLEEVA